jgi:hypothetical protein
MLWSKVCLIGTLCESQPDDPLSIDIATILLALASVFLIAFMKGAVGGGFAIVGIPLLSFCDGSDFGGGIACAVVCAHGSVRTTLLEAVDLVEIRSPRPRAVPDSRNWLGLRDSAPSRRSSGCDCDGGHHSCLYRIMAS